MSQTSAVRGGDRLAATLSRAAREVGDMRPATEQAAATVTRDARARAPRRSGALAASTVGRAERNRAVITATVVYAGVIHNGWRAHHISPHPFIADALDAQQGRVLDLYTAEADKIISRVTGA